MQNQDVIATLLIGLLRTAASSSKRAVYKWGYGSPRVNTNLLKVAGISKRAHEDKILNEKSTVSSIITGEDLMFNELIKDLMN